MVLRSCGPMLHKYACMLIETKRRECPLYYTYNALEVAQGPEDSGGAAWLPFQLSGLGVGMYKRASGGDGGGAVSGTPPRGLVGPGRGRPAGVLAAPHLKIFGSMLLLPNVGFSGTGRSHLVAAGGLGENGHPNIMRHVGDQGSAAKPDRAGDTIRPTGAPKTAARARAAPG